jgi:D-3-phosphoglycerate dehydrogenase
MKVLVTDKSAEEALQVLKDAGHDVTYDEMDADTLLKEISKYDAIMVRSRTKVVTDVVNAGAKGNLKVIGRAGIGVDNIDIETAAKQGIPVVNSPTGATASVAELAIAHMLALSRHIPKADSTMKKGEWAKKQLKGNELFGKTLGLIGSGSIAQHTAKIAKGFGMEVVVYSPHCTDEKAKKIGAERVSLENLLKQSDFVSLHIPHTKDSHYLIDEKAISLMKNTAHLIDVSRGGVVNQKALYKALKEGKIAGAGIDVFEKEPPEDNPFIDFGNVVLSPHIGANTKEGQIRAGTVCAEQINKVLKGEKPDYCVNKNLM